MHKILTDSIFTFFGNSMKRAKKCLVHSALKQEGISLLGSM